LLLKIAASTRAQHLTRYGTPEQVVIPATARDPIAREQRSWPERASAMDGTSQAGIQFLISPLQIKRQNWMTSFAVVKRLTSSAVVKRVSLR
jgi:hypothetical protein